MSQIVLTPPLSADMPAPIESNTGQGKNITPFDQRTDEGRRLLISAFRISSAAL